MLSQIAKSLLMRTPGLSGLVAQRDRLRMEHELLLEKLNQQSQPNFTSVASAAAAFELFKGEWASDIPGFGMGELALFDDPRVHWLGKQLGGFAGKRILELGPLEGAHSWMMSRAGAAQIVAIEANVRAFLKCLIVKNALKFDADFWLGDFCAYLANTNHSYDFVLASGVLYHIIEPVQLLADVARVAPRVGLWTHYYDRDVMSARAELRTRFARAPRVERFRGREVVTFEQRYVHPVGSPWFRGGPAEVSRWLTRESLLAVLDALGFHCVIHEDTKEHPNGPALLIYASAPGAG
jgi:Protein of unknown function (DUF1698)